MKTYQILLLLVGNALNSTSVPVETTKKWTPLSCYNQDCYSKYPQITLCILPFFTLPKFVLPYPEKIATRSKVKTIFFHVKTSTLNFCRFIFTRLHVDLWNSSYVSTHCIIQRLRQHNISIMKNQPVVLSGAMFNTMFPTVE